MKSKEILIYCPGKLPDKPKERAEFYETMEKMGILRIIFGSFDDKEIIVRERRKYDRRTNP